MSTVEVIATTCWYLWWIRRRATHNESVPPPTHWMMSILPLYNAFVRANQKNVTRQMTRWEKPGKDDLKLNVDASFHEDVGMGVIAAIIRDDS